jgi:hypothetical protein
LTNFFKGPLRKESNSSTDSGNTSGRGFGDAAAAAATGAGGRDAVGGGAAPFVFGVSTVADAISSSREVAASSLWMIAVSSARGMVGKTLSFMVVVMLTEWWDEI